MRSIVVVASLLLGCGRYQFERRSDAAVAVVDDVAGDDAADASTCAFTFCDDFDRTDPQGDWDSVTTAGTGTGSITNGVLTVTLTAEGDRYHLVKDLPAPTTSVTFSARMSLTCPAGGIAEVDLVPLNWLADTCVLPFGFYLVRNSTGDFNLQETNGNAACDNNKNNYYGVRDNIGPFDVRMTVLVGNPGTVKLEVAGAEVHNDTTFSVVPSAPLQLKLGGIVRDVTGPWTITYENVIIDVQ